MDERRRTVVEVRVDLHQRLRRLAVLNDHTLLIADTYHDRIAALNLTTGAITNWPPTP